MKTVVFFLFCTFISCACFMTALGSKTPFLLYAIGFGVWGAFCALLQPRDQKTDGAPSDGAAVPGLYSDTVPQQALMPFYSFAL